MLINQNLFHVYYLYSIERLGC